MTNNSWRLLYFLIVSVVAAQDCDNVCYKDVKNGLTHLEDLYGKPPAVSNIPPMFEDVISLINKTENIISAIPELDEIKNRSLSIQETISHSGIKLKLLKDVVTEIDRINKTLLELQYKKDNHSKTFNECEKASSLYDTLRKDVADINEYGKKISAAFGAIYSRIDGIKNQSLNIKYNLDEINTSDSVYQKYLCNSRLRSTVKDIIEIMKKIADKLRATFAEIVDLKLRELERNIIEYEKVIEEIERSLDERLPETELITTGKTRPLLEDLRAQVDDLKTKIKDMRLDKTFEDMLENAKQKLKDLINEYEQILNLLFSDETKKKVKKEIQKAKETLNLLKEKEMIKAEVDDIKKIVDKLTDGEVCFIYEPVSVEDKT